MCNLTKLLRHILAAVNKILEKNVVFDINHLEPRQSWATRNHANVGPYKIMPKWGRKESCQSGAIWNHAKVGPYKWWRFLQKPRLNIDWAANSTFSLNPFSLSI